MVDAGRAESMPLLALSTRRGYDPIAALHQLTGHVCLRRTIMMSVRQTRTMFHVELRSGAIAIFLVLPTAHRRTRSSPRPLP